MIIAKLLDSESLPRMQRVIILTGVVHSAEKYISFAFAAIKRLVEGIERNITINQYYSYLLHINIMMSTW